MNTSFEELTKDFQNIQKIRNYEFKYDESRVVEYYSNLLTKALDKYNDHKWHPSRYNIDYHGKYTFSAIKRFYTTGCCMNDSNQEMSWGYSRKYLPQFSELDNIAKLVMDYDELGSHKVETVKSAFNDIGLDVKYWGYNSETDKYVHTIKLNDSNNLRLSDDVELAFSIDYGNNTNVELAIELHDTNFCFCGFDEYGSRIFHRFTLVNKFTFIPNKIIPLTNVKLFESLLNNLIPYLSEVLTHKSAISEIQTYRYRKDEIEFKVEYKHYSLE